MPSGKSTYFKKAKNGLISFVLILGITHAVFAVDGIVTKSRSSKASFSNLKKNLSLSLHSGFSYHDNKSFGFKKVDKDHFFNSMISFQKGNITYILPYKNKMLLHKFKTPQKPASH